MSFFVIKLLKQKIYKKNNNNNNYNNTKKKYKINTYDLFCLKQKKKKQKKNINKPVT